jgi:hypothetical protein
MGDGHPSWESALKWARGTKKGKRHLNGEGTRKWGEDIQFGEENPNGERPSNLERNT